MLNRISRFRLRKAKRKPQVPAAPQAPAGFVFAPIGPASPAVSELYRAAYEQARQMVAAQAAHCWN